MKLMQIMEWGPYTIRPSKKTTFFSKNYSSDQNLALNTNNEENEYNLDHILWQAFKVILYYLFAHIKCYE